MSDRELHELLESMRLKGIPEEEIFGYFANRWALGDLWTSLADEKRGESLAFVAACDHREDSLRTMLDRLKILRVWGSEILTRKSDA